MATEMEAEMEAAVDSMAKVMELVLEVEGDSTDKVMETDKATGMETDKVTGTEMDPMAKAVIMETEVVSTAKVMEEALDLVKEMDTGDRSFSEMAPTIRNDSRGRPPSIQR